MLLQKLKRILILQLMLATVIGAGLIAAPAYADKAMDRPYQFDDQGNLIQPKGYRAWIFVGSPLTPNDMNNGKAAFPEFHHVYIPQAAFEVYKSTGAFPDGTILIKELLSVGEKQAPSGKGYFNGDFIGLEAAVKDTRRFKDEPGHWAYFSFTTPIGQPHKKKVKAFSKNKCNFCHQALAKDDWVFTQYYPVLKAAKPGRK